jgi:hypothetical protein
MAFTAATAQATIETARQAIIKAEQKLELYIQINNPSLLADTDAALAAAATAIAAVRA